MKRYFPIFVFRFSILNFPSPSSSPQEPLQKTRKNIENKKQKDKTH